MNKTEKDFWIEMSVREISTQCHFAEISYNNIDLKVERKTDLVFSSIHSFLSHCAMVSKMLSSKDRSLNCFDKILVKIGIIKKPFVIGDVLEIPTSSIIHNRKFRNNLEHYDERLKKWIKEKGINVSIGTYNIGPKSMIQIPNMIFVSHYDPTNNIFTFVNKDFNLGDLYDEVTRIKSLADKWVLKVQSGIIRPPYFKN